MSEYSEVFRCIVFADARFIFSKWDIQNPMQTIFNAPVTANSMAEAFGIIFDTADVVWYFNTDIFADMAFTLNHANGIDVFPWLFTLYGIAVLKGYQNHRFNIYLRD